MVSREYSCFDYRKEAPPILGNARHLCLQDKEAVQSLITEASKRMFGYVDVSVLLNVSYVCIGLENVKKDLVAAMFLNNYPNVPSIPSWDWFPWLYNIYGIRHISSRNTLWVHLAVYLNEYTKVFLQKILTDVFTMYPPVKYIVFISPPHVKFTEWLVAKSVQIRPKAAQGRPAQTLHVFTRQCYTPCYKTRAAVVEDNDDVVALVDTHSKRLRQIYGDYYIAEILKVDPDRKIIVAEHNEQTVAVMCLNSVVNHELLNEQFQLEPYHGLMVPYKTDLIRPGALIEDEEDLSGSSTSSLLSRDFSRTPPSEDSWSDTSIRNLNDALENLSFDDECDDETDSTEEDENIILFRSSDAQGGKEFIGYADPKFSNSQLTYSSEERMVWKEMRTIRGSATLSSASTKASLLSRASSYFGGGNCFCLELAAAEPEHEQSLRTLLVAGFELYPDRDYCVLSVPSTAPPFDLQSEVFVRVPPRPRSTFPSEIYVAHRTAISGRVKVRDARAEDVLQVQELLRTCSTGNIVYGKFVEVVTDTTNLLEQAYVVLCYQKIVGVAVLSELLGMDYLNSHYNISRYTDLSKHKPGCLGQLQYFTLSPLFLKYGRVIMLELHRLSDYSFLCYKLAHVGSKSSSMPLPVCLGYMLPVMPSDIPEYRVREDQQSDDEWKAPGAFAVLEKPYACYISTPMHCGGTRIEVNDKVVIVGASNVALSFLVELAFQQESTSLVTFNNLTLVSTHGLPLWKGYDLKNIMIPLTSNIDSNYLSLISLTTYVNVIRGVMEGIDRKQKCITVNASSVPYDVLILTCGKQFPMPQRTGLNEYTYEHPRNVFVINTGEDVDVAISKLKHCRTRRGPELVIIYGDTVESYCTVQAMLKFGFPPSEVVLVLPEEQTAAHSTASTFNDPDVDRAVKVYTKNAGVTIYKGFSFKGWKFDSNYYGVTSVSFQSLHRLMQLPCLAIFMYLKKNVSKRTFNAIHKAGLIYDGALVINPNFTTNDRDIYAAGTFTKYPRRYYADHMLQAYYDQSEIGKHLSRTINKRLLSGRLDLEKRVGFFDQCHPPEKMLVPRYSDPVKIYASIPGYVQYFSLRKPGFVTPHAITANKEDHGMVITTGTWKNLGDRGYFKLHLSTGRSVETITCLSKSYIETVNLTHVWGKHEKLLNNLVTRHYMGLIDDLFDYFAKPYMMAIFNTNFKQLSNEIMDIMTSLAEVKGESLIEDVVEMFEMNNWAPLSKSQKFQLVTKFTGSGYEKKMEKGVLEFLQDNHSILPMYGNSMMYNVIVGTVQESPLFNPL